MKFLKFLDSVYVSVFSFVPYKINTFISKFFKKLHNLNLAATYKKDFLANLNILNVKFKLWLLGNDLQAQTVYQKLHNTNKVYEIILIKLLKNLIDTYQYKSILDLGSFMGYFSCFLGKYSDDLKIYAIESNKNYCDCIKKSVNENKLDNIKIYNNILSNKSAEMYFYKEAVYEKPDINVQMKKNYSITLDELCKKNEISPQIAKIDVHGAEGLVLDGSKRILEKNLKFLLLELHTNNYLNKFSNNMNRNNVINIILESGFNCYLVSSFRSSDYQNELNTDKSEMKFLKLNYDTLNTCLFDRDNEDILIFAAKNDIALDKLGYDF